MSGDNVTTISEYLVRHHAARVADLRALGVSQSAIDRLRRTGFLVSLGHGIVGLGACADPWRQRVAAALLLYPEAVLSHQTAAQLLDLPVRSEAIHVTVAPGTRRKGTVRVHRTTHLPDNHRRSLEGLPFTSRARTVCDLAVEAADDGHYHFLVQQALTHPRLDHQGLLSCHAELSLQGRLGAGRRNRVLRDLFSEQPLIATSELERRFFDLSKRFHLPGLEFQVRPPWSDGQTGVVDAAIPSVRLVIELDGRRYHATMAAFQADRERDRRAAEHGWRVLRFSWKDVVERPDVVAASILRAIRVTPSLAFGG